MSSTIINATFTQRPDLADAFYELNPDGVQYAARQVFPMLPVDTQNGSIEILSKENLTQDIDTSRSPAAEFKRVGKIVGGVDYKCVDHGVEHPIEKSDGSTIQLNKEMAAMSICQSVVMNALEKEVKGMIFDTGTYTGSSLYLDTSTAWSSASADIPGDIETAIQKVQLNSGLMPNAMVMTPTILGWMIKNTAVKNMFPGIPMLTRSMLEAQMGNLFGIEKIILSTAQNSSGYIFGGDYVQVCRVASDGAPMNAPCIGRIAAWTEDNGPDLASVVTYWEPRRKSMIYQVSHNIDPIICYTEAGFLLKVS